MTTILLSARSDEWTKDPADTIVFEFDWRWWVPDGVTIETATCEIDPLVADTLTVDSTDIVGVKVRPTLSGGTLGAKPPVVCTVTLSDGQVFQTEKTVVVRNRRS